MRHLIDSFKERYRGIAICVIGALASSWLSEHYQTPVMLLALLLGLAFHFLSEDEQIAHGVEWVARGLLRVGVALLGLRIAFGDIISGGWLGPVIIVIAMLATFLTGAFLARQLGLTMPFGWLSAGSVAVCGVSAAIAISSVLPKRDEADEELAVVVISVTALSTLAMIFYPVIASALAFSDVMAGMFIGGSIHDVAQVVGAGYSISEAAGDTATYIKLMRVALLLPIVFIIGATSRSASSSEERPPLLPGFLVVFVALAIVNSLGWTIPSVNAGIGMISRTFLVMAIFAIGVKSRLKDIFKVGPRPFVLICSETLVMAVVVVAGLLWFGTVVGEV